MLIRLSSEVSFVANAASKPAISALTPFIRASKLAISATVGKPPIASETAAIAELMFNNSSWMSAMP